MFENMTLEVLQAYWWVIISLLGALLVFLMFVQGGQSLLRMIAKTNEEKSLVINSLGRKWELTFTTLVTFGGAFFASFPLFYATSFGGAYWVWMILLFSFIVQAVSYEFRTKAGNILGQDVYESFLVANGLVAPLVLGTAVGTFFTGSMFIVNDLNLSTWMHPARGIEALFNVTNISLSATVLLLSRQLGAMYIINSVDNQLVAERSRKQVKREAIPFLLFAVLFLMKLVTADGFATDNHGLVHVEPYKYAINLVEMPHVLAMLFTGLTLLITSMFLTIFKSSNKAIWLGGSGTVLLVLALFFTAGFNHTAFYPSTVDPQSSLTIQNSSSSHYTLVAMSYVSLFVPFVATYIWLMWRKMNARKLTSTELEEEHHVY